MMRIWQAKKELVITSPYMIPGRKGLESIEKLRQQDIKVTVMTNSLAATDEPLVHTGYSRYRYDMLLAGVDIYELSPSLTQRSKRLGTFGQSLGRLHSKTVDHRQRNGVHRIDESRSALAGDEHRNGHVLRQPAARERTAAGHQHHEAAKRVSACGCNPTGRAFSGWRPTATRRSCWVSSPNRPRCCGCTTSSSACSFRSSCSERAQARASSARIASMTAL